MSGPEKGGAYTRYQSYVNYLINGLQASAAFIEVNQRFLREIQSHLSFDTYFKKLFHKNQTINILENKYLLYLYFIYEHVAEIDIVNEYGWNVKNSGKLFSVDPRYDALIAGLLKPIKGQTEFYTKINFITWNYDCNLLFALFNFLSKNISFNSFIEKYYMGDNTFKFGEQVQLFHLNGFIKNESISSLGNQDRESLNRTFTYLINQYQNEIVMRDFIKSMSFSWENVPSTGDVPSFVVDASKAVTESHSLIVTGYSFPLYNRIFDQKLLMRENINNLTIYLRDPNCLELEKVLHSDFKITSPPTTRKTNETKSATVFLNNSVQSFFIPANIYV